MVGIYKITSPSGKVYIGQSWDINKRLRYYQSHKYCSGQIMLSRSIKKHGIDAHNVEIVQLLPHDITQTTLDNYEIYFISQLKEAGVELLNMKEGGARGKLPQESIEKIKAKRLNQQPPTLGYKFSKESRARMSQSQAGRVRKPETTAKISAKTKGRKASEETKSKLKAAKAKYNYWCGKNHKEESKQKQRLAKIGNKINNKKVKRLDNGQVFNSLSEAAQSINIPMKTLSARILNGVNKPPLFTYEI